MTVDDESIIQELKDEHGITAVVLRCPCDNDPKDPGHPILRCPYCSGDGKIQYGIDECEFL